MIANSCSLAVKGYVDKRAACSASELIAKRAMYPGRGADISVQVIFVPKSHTNALPEPGTLYEHAADFGQRHTAYILGWVSGKPDRIPPSATHAMSDLVKNLQSNKRVAPICPQCGASLVRKTNRATGEEFWGRPNYRSHIRG